MAGRRSADVGQHQLDAFGDLRLRAARAALDAPHDGYRNRSVLGGSAGEMAADECGAGSECGEFADRRLPRHRRHAAIGAWEEPLSRDEGERTLDRRGHLTWCLDMLARHIDR